jgi:hypothetical protein
MMRYFVVHSLSMPTRRTFLLAGTAGAAALAAAWWLRGEHDIPPAAPGTLPLARLDPEAPAIIAAVAPVLLDGALPTESAAGAAALKETVANVAAAVAGLPPSAQKELGELFALLAFAPARIALARVDSPWEKASRDEVAAFLERWRTSRFLLLRSAYGALHQLVFAAWYGNPSSWSVIGYPGPPQLTG